MNVFPYAILKVQLAGFFPRKQERTEIKNPKEVKPYILSTYVIDKWNAVKTKEPLRAHCEENS